MIITIPNIFALKEAAQALLATCKQKRIIAFYGEMGVGKTTFIQAICKELGVKTPVSSPTYALVQEYQGHDLVYHFDLYRLEQLQEAYDIGIEEYLDSDTWCLIEWPQIIAPLLGQEAVEVHLQLLPDQSRTLTIVA